MLPPVVREWQRAMLGNRSLSTSGGEADRRVRRLAVSWAGFGGMSVLIAVFIRAVAQGATSPPGLVTLVTPANLFTGVLACGLICALNLWVDSRFMPPPLRMGRTLFLLNALAAGLFVLLGLKAYWDYRGVTAMLILAATVGVGWLAAGPLKRGLSACADFGAASAERKEWQNSGKQNDKGQEK